MSCQRNAFAVGLFGWAVKLAGWLQAIPNKITPPPFRLIQVGSAFWQSRALYVAARLDVATVLGDGEMDAADIAARVGADADATARLLRLLAAVGIFEETASHRFCNNRCSAFLRRDHPNSVRAMVLMHNSEVMSRPWFESLEEGVRRGMPPFQLTHGEDLFAYLDKHREMDTLFSEAMDSVETLVGDCFATDFDWGRFNRIIDVGGSRGTKSLAILRRHARLTALVVDRPQVVAEARAYWEANAAPESQRMEFQSGDVLQSVPLARGDGDIYLLSAVLHCFDDDSCRLALGNLARAMAGSGARIALLEMVLPEGGADPAVAAFDMQMFMGTRGRERTLMAWKALVEASGLVLEEVVGLRSIAKILVLKSIH